MTGRFLRILADHQEITLIGILAGITCIGSVHNVHAQEQHTAEPHRTYADEQTAAETEYQAECGNQSLKGCNSDLGSLKHKRRVRAYQDAINATITHLKDENMKRSDVRSQSFVYLLGSDSEKADLPLRAYMFYQQCAQILSVPGVIPAEIPSVVEDGSLISVKTACQTAATRLSTPTPGASSNETTVTMQTIHEASGDDHDTWQFVAVSTETVPGLDPPRADGLDGKPQPAESAAEKSYGVVGGESSAQAASARATEAATKTALKQVNAAAKAAKKQADAEAKAAKAQADAPDKAAKKEERDRARAERAARREEEAKEHPKKD